MHDPQPRFRTEQLARRYDRAVRWGIAASLLLHLLLFLLFRGQSMPISPLAAAGPRAGDDAAAAGGGMQALNLQTRPPLEEIARPPEPILVPDAVLEQVLEDTEPEVQPVNLSQLQGTAGEQKGPDQGPGLESGTGKGDGGTAERGLFRVIPPSPRGMILPPSAPRDVRGREVEVWVFVTAGGKVIADSTRLRPPTGDRRYDERLRRQASQWIFEPAKKGGKPVAEWFQYVVTL